MAERMVLAPGSCRPHPEPGLTLSKAFIVKDKPGKTLTDHCCFTVFPPESLEVADNGVSLAPHPNLQAFMEVLPEPGVRVCSKTVSCTWSRCSEQ